MSDDLTATATRLIELGFNDGRREIIGELVAHDVLEHQQFGPDHPGGPAGVAAVVESLHRAFSDFRLTIEDSAQCDRTVWLRMTATGTNDGMFMGYPPTGRTIRVDVIDVMRFDDGKMVEHWGVPDRLGVMMQLGLIGPPGAGRR